MKNREKIMASLNLVSRQFSVTKMISAQKALPIEFTKYKTKFDRKIFKLLFNEAETQLSYKSGLTSRFLKIKIAV